MLLLSPTPRVPLTPDMRSRSVDATLQRPILPGSKVPNPPAESRPQTTSSCGHTNAGQELCYLCHQRARRNIPISFAEERKRREQEEDQLFQKYQHMKDQEAIIQEQVSYKGYNTGTGGRYKAIIQEQVGVIRL